MKNKKKNLNDADVAKIIAKNHILTNKLINHEQLKINKNAIFTLWAAMFFLSLFFALTTSPVFIILGMLVMIPLVGFELLFDIKITRSWKKIRRILRG